MTAMLTGRSAATSSCAPARLVAQPPGQALVVRPVVLLQGGPHFPGHGRARAGIAALEDGMAAAGQPEELKHPVIDRPGVGEVGIAVDDVDPLPAEDPFQPLELPGVLTAGAVGVVLVATADVRRVSQDPFDLAFEAGGVSFPCSFKWFCLQA